MTEQVKKKSGRKPIGDKAMTRNERMKKTNDARRARGVRSFLLHVEPMHMQWIEQTALSNGLPPTKVLREVLESALDRYAGVMSRVQFLEVDCNNPEAAASFVRTHLLPTLPSFEELGAQFKKETQ